MHIHPCTWIAFCKELSGIVHGKAKEEDLGLLETQPGFMEGQGLIFLEEEKQQHYIFTK